MKVIAKTETISDEVRQLVRSNFKSRMQKSEIIKTFNISRSSANRIINGGVIKKRGVLHHIIKKD